LNYLDADNVVVSGFYSMFQIPFAGLRQYSDALLYRLRRDVYLWSSSPYSTTYPNSRTLYLNDSYVGAAIHNRRAYGFPVRCFSNDYMFTSPSMTIYPNG
jgi:hypothetical protein